MAELIPFALKDAPALIEAVYPAQKISYEAQRERKAGTGQTLPSIGSYWKGRKPLILAKSIIVGCLLPQTDDAEMDLQIYEMLLGFDLISLAKRAIANRSIKCDELVEAIEISNPWEYFTYRGKDKLASQQDNDFLSCPFSPGEFGISLQWKKGIKDGELIELYEKFLSTLSTYEERAALGKRSEEVDQIWLYDHVWTILNKHYGHLGVNCSSIESVIEQFGLLRFGRTPKVGDTFSGGGSIPFEAARLGCESYAADINPIACMLNWGNFNIIGADDNECFENEEIQKMLADTFEDEINSLGFEYDENGNRAKSYLYCLETKCPETGWMIPLSPSWVISKGSNVIASLQPNKAEKKFDILIKENVSSDEMRKAELGTVVGGNMVYQLEGKQYITPIKTIRGEYKDEHGNTVNRLRLWCKEDIEPRADDILQERLYCIQWVSKETLHLSRKNIFFKTVDDNDLARERKLTEYVKRNLSSWQSLGYVADMEIETGKENEGPIRTNGWTHWHHMFTPRQILMHALYLRIGGSYPIGRVISAKLLDYCNKSCQWRPRGDYPEQLFSGQSMKTMFTWGARSGFSLRDTMLTSFSRSTMAGKYSVKNIAAKDIEQELDLIITDPPYADAVNYHEITEFFIAWLRKNPPAPFDQWTWDSRRALAIKGIGDEFRKSMAEAYSAMARKMPDNGMQCVMFTHQDTSVWSDMVGIFWAAGLQVVGAWYIATETTSELKKGGYVQGTVILMLRKRPAGENQGFKQRLLPAVRAEVKRQIETMMHLNDEVKDKLGEPVFNDSDLQMAGYAAALKVLTSYTHIGGEDVTSFALRPRTKGEVTVVDEIVQQAAEAANSLLVPERLSADTWQKINGIQRFYLRMMDIETTGAAKLDNYQNFAKAFRVADYSRVMGNMAANKAQLKQVHEFAPRDLSDSTEIGVTWLGHLIIGLQQILNEKEPQTVISQLQADLPDFMEVRPILIDMLSFIEMKAPEQATRNAAEVLGARLKNMRALGE